MKKVQNFKVSVSHMQSHAYSGLLGYNFRQFSYLDTQQEYYTTCINTVLIFFHSKKLKIYTLFFFIRNMFLRN